MNNLLRFYSAALCFGSLSFILGFIFYLKISPNSINGIHYLTSAELLEIQIKLEDDDIEGAKKLLNASIEVRNSILMNKDLSHADEK